MITALVLAAMLGASIVTVIVFPFAFWLGERRGRLEERGRTMRAALDRELSTTVDLIAGGEDEALVSAYGEAVSDVAQHDFDDPAPHNQMLALSRAREALIARFGSLRSQFHAAQERADRAERELAATDEAGARAVDALSAANVALQQELATARLNTVPHFLTWRDVDRLHALADQADNHADFEADMENINEHYHALRDRARWLRGVANLIAAIVPDEDGDAARSPHPPSSA